MKPVILVSKTTDGNMLEGKNRHNFLTSKDINPNNTTCVKLSYEGDDYCRYLEVHEKHMGKGIVDDEFIIADALLTKVPGHALFLPLADCIGAVFFDPSNNVLMLSHLGRHNLEQFGGRKSVEYMIEKHGCDPNLIRIWLSPAAGRDSYPLFAFDNISLKDAALFQLIAAGINPDNVIDDSIDTTKNLNYFSHSEFLKNNRSTDGRFSVVALMR